MVPRGWGINALERRVKVRTRSTVDIFTGSRCLVRSIERAYISGWLLARRRERWRTSEIAGKRAEETEGARREMGYTRDSVYGVSQNRSMPLILMTGTSTKMESVFPEGDVS